MAKSKAHEVSSAPNRWQDRTGKWAFAVFFALGFAAIMFIEVYELSKFISMAICGALMVAYSTLTYALPAFRARADQIGDNVYYLGLLFTLFSLTAAIVRLANDENAAEGILRNFGIALVTTILGIALRVIISQMRDDPVDIERETRATLLASTRAFREELDQSTTVMRQFHLSIRQRVEETVEESLRHLSNGFREAEKVEAAMTSLVTTLNRAAQSAETLNATVERVAQGAGKFDSVNDQLERLSISLAEADRAAQAMHTQFRGLGTSLGEGIGASMGDMLSGNSRVTGEAAKALANLRDSAQEMDAAAKSMAKLAQTFRTELGQSHEVIAKVRDEMADLATYVLNRLEA